VLLNGEAPLSLMQGTAEGRDSGINGIDGTSNIPAGAEFAGTYTSNVLPYKLPLGIKLKMRNALSVNDGGVIFGINLRSAGVNKPIQIRREETNNRWRLYIDGTEVASTQANIDANLGTTAFTVELKVDEDGLISLEVNDNELDLYDVSSGTILDTLYDTALSEDDMSSDLVLVLIADSEALVELISAYATAEPFQPLVTVYDNSQIEKKNLISNVESGFSAVKTSNWNTDVTETPQWLVRTVGIIDDSTNKRVAEINVNFEADRNWDNLTIDAEGNKSLVHFAGGISGLPGISGSTFTLYVPKNSSDTAVYICPNASLLADVSTSCTGGYSVDDDDDNVTIVTVDGQQYWKITGLTGTGGISYQASNNSSDNNNDDDDDNDDNDDDKECSEDVGIQPPYLYDAVAQGPHSILLYFTEAADPIEYYSMKYGYIQDIYNETKNNIGVKSKSRMTYLVENLSPNTTYYFKVRGNNGCASGDWSNDIEAKTKPNFSTVTGANFGANLASTTTTETTTENKLEAAEVIKENNATEDQPNLVVNESNTSNNKDEAALNTTNYSKYYWIGGILFVLLLAVIAWSNLRR
jgi:hypothetical protein